MVKEKKDLKRKIIQVQKKVEQLNKKLQQSRASLEQNESSIITTGKRKYRDEKKNYIEKEASPTKVKRYSLAPDNYNRNQNAALIVSDKSLDKKLLMKSIQKEFGKDSAISKDMKNL